MGAVYRPRSRWRRWVAFTIAVFGLTAMVMLLGVLVVMVLTSAPEPTRRAPAEPTVELTVEPAGG